MKNKLVERKFIDRRYHISPPGRTTQYKIDDIYFDPSIVMFEDLNCLFLIYIELNESSSNQTKRIKLQTKKRKTKKNKLK